MTYSHEEANARLLDLIYGEAAPAERADLEAHVAGCARCQAELAALGGTRAVVRAALVDEPPPQSVHARLMRAATEAVAPVQAATAAASPGPRARAAVPPEAPSLWRKLRAGWTLPTFATVGAFAILLLASKVFLNPERTYERGQQGIVPAEPAPAASVRDVENAPAAVAAPEDKSADKMRAPEARADEAFRAQGPGDRDDEGQRRRKGGPAREHGAATLLGKSMRHEPGLDGLSGSLGSETGQEAFGGPEWRHAGSGGKVPGLGNIRSVPGSVAGGGSGAAAVGGVSGLSRGGASAPKPAMRAREAADDFAAPPAGWQKGGAPAAAPASPAPPPAPSEREAPTAKADRKAVEELDEMEAAPSRLKAEKATASEEPPPAEKKKAAPRPVAAASSAPAAQAPAKDLLAKSASDAKERDAAPTQEALARRAEQLFVARRWDEAVAAYRELLRRFPDAGPAAKWRTHLAQAERESAAVTASRAAAKSAPKAAAAKPETTKAAKKTVSDDPAEGM